MKHFLETYLEVEGSYSIKLVKLLYGVFCRCIDKALFLSVWLMGMLVRSKVVT